MTKKGLTLFGYFGTEQGDKLIRSMTGFGKGEFKRAKSAISVEIRTFNHRFLEPAFRLPDRLALFEDRIKVKVKRRVERGKVNLAITLKKEGCPARKVSIDRELAKKYHHMVAGLKKELRLKDDIGLAQILSFPEVLVYEEPEQDLNRLWPHIEQALEQALDKLVKSREIEGNVLYNDLIKRLGLISGSVGKIEKQLPLVVKGYKRRLEARIRSLTKTRKLDAGKIEFEIALFAKNCDISEEVTRIKGHVNNFRKVLSKQGGIGQELDFIAQELNREANTIGSKANDFRIANEVIKIKTEIERIREQAHNVE